VCKDSAATAVTHAEENQAMTIINFLHRMHYHTAERPEDVSPGRWKGMLLWYETSHKNGDLARYGL